MSNILKIFDQDFVLKYFNDEILAFYPDYLNVDSVIIKPYKKMIWDDTYHVVVSFDITLSGRSGEEKKVFLVCSAHSEEPRENVFEVLTHLWKTGFANGWIDVPYPLFYSPFFKGVFYSGLIGENILKKVRNDLGMAAEKIALSGRMFAELHSMSIDNVPEFNPHSARIKTVIPGVENVLAEMSHRYDKKYDKDLKDLYERILEKEEKIFKERANLCLIHGDAHLENLIDTGPARIGIIDFADFCIGDFARDLGTFMQQLEYRATSIKEEKKDMEKENYLKRIFLEEYISAKGIDLTDDLKERIKLYYDWTMVRTATYFFLKADSEPERAEDLLKRTIQSMNSDSFII